MTYPQWSTSLKTAPEQHPVTLGEAKLHLRVDATDDDDLIDSLIAAATGVIETYTGRALFTQTWYLRLDAFPRDDVPIWLPRPPAQSVTAVTYVDADGVTQTWSASLYQKALPAGPKAQYGRLLPAYGESYPTTREQLDAVTVEYVCGWSTLGNGAVVTDIPRALHAAALLLVGHLYEHREAVVVGAIANPLPLGIEALLAPYVVTKWGV